MTRLWVDANVLLRFLTGEPKEPPHHVLAHIHKPSPALAHLVPDASERVVGEELHDVPGREELIANGQLAAVPRSLRGVPHRSPLLLRIEILVDPADRLVLVPDTGKLGSIEGFQKLVERRPARPEHRGRVPAVEEHFNLGGELVEDAFEIEPVSGAVRQQRHSLREAAEFTVAA